jgi:4'-phosphopantetheinyl transferase
MLWTEPATDSSTTLDIWQIPLSIPSPVDLAGLRALLDSDERAQSERFRFERDRRRYLVSHAAGRHILARYLGAGPADLRFVRQAHGKPVLDPGRHPEGIHFNLTHGGELALLAVTRAGPVGVDVEPVRRLDDALSVARHFFAADELAALRRVHGTPFEAESFFRCWTRKEAFIKAIGEGLSFPLDAFTVSLLPDEPLRLQVLSRHPTGQPALQIGSFVPRSGYQAAFVAPDEVQVVTLWQVADLTAGGLTPLPIPVTAGIIQRATIDFS